MTDDEKLTLHALSDTTGRIVTFTDFVEDGMDVEIYDDPDEEQGWQGVERVYRSESGEWRVRQLTDEENRARTMRIMDEARRHADGLAAKTRSVRDVTIVAGEVAEGDAIVTRGGASLFTVARRTLDGPYVGLDGAERDLPFRPGPKPTGPAHAHLDRSREISYRWPVDRVIVVRR